MSTFSLLFIGFCVGVAVLSLALVVVDILTRGLDKAIDAETASENIEQRARG